MTIVLQLKSTQRETDLDDISAIIDAIYNKYNYKIRGHEIQQLDGIMKKTTLTERANMVSKFCSVNELDYLTYHTRIFENGENIWDDKWTKEIHDSILITIEEAERVHREVGLKNKVIIVFHLTNYFPRSSLSTLTKEKKFQMMEKSEQTFLKLMHPYIKGTNNDNDRRSGYYYNNNNGGERKGDEAADNAVMMAVENSYPKVYANYAITSPFHPSEIARLENYGIKTVFDLSHYHLYSNYLRYGSGNSNGDLDRQIYGSVPNWNEAAEILASSLVQLHISDAKGYESKGEGLSLGEGEIDIRTALIAFDNAVSRSSIKRKGKNNDSDISCKVDSIIQGTIELDNGHLNHSRLQQKSAEWLLVNIPNIFG